MKTLSPVDVAKFASVSAKFRKLLSGITKTGATDDNTEFSEKPPVNEEEEDIQSTKPTESKPKKQEKPPEELEEQIPQETEPQVSEDPGEIGARAAQAFIGPEIMEAALSGDPNAQEIIARTAGHVAGSVAEAALKTMGSAEMVEEGVPSEEMLSEDANAAVPIEENGQGAPAQATAVPAAPATTEEQFADTIVPPENTEATIPPGETRQVEVLPSGQPAPAKAKEFPPKKNNQPPKQVQNGGEYDAETVGKLIQLAKAGKI